MDSSRSINPTENGDSGLVFPPPHAPQAEGSGEGKGEWDSEVVTLLDRAEAALIPGLYET